MTVVTDMETLDGLAVGERVTLTNQGNQLWTRTEAGFTSDGTELSLSMFEPEVRAGGVRVGVTPQRGQLWRDASGFYYHIMREVRTGDEVTWHATMLHSSGEFYADMASTDPSRNWGEPTDDMPGWWNSALQSLLNVHRGEVIARQQEVDRRQHRDREYTQRIENLTERLRQAEAGFTVDKVGFEVAIHEWMEGADFDADSGLADVLDNYGFARPPRPTEQITVTVAVEGNTYFTCDNETVEQYVGEGVDNYDSDRFRIDWSKELTFEVEVEDGECGCNDVSRTMIENRLRQVGLSFDDIDYETDCEND